MSKELVRYESTPAQQKTLIEELRRWKWMLENKRDQANRIIENIAKQITLGSDPHRINTAISKLKDGVMTPKDYNFPF